jgi:hypothetical protein
MRDGWRRAGLVIGVLAATIGPARAHHALIALYDQNRPITLRGSITRVEWNNPHAYIVLDAMQPDGTVRQWRVEIAAPRVLASERVTREMLAIGTAVIITGTPARSGEAQAAGRDITFPDGTTRLLLETRNLGHVSPTPWRERALPYIYGGTPPLVVLVVGLAIIAWRRSTQKRNISKEQG